MLSSHEIPCYNCVYKDLEEAKSSLQKFYVAHNDYPHGKDHRYLAALHDIIVTIHSAQSNIYEKVMFYGI